jgi:hypothetical protein
VDAVIARSPLSHLAALAAALATNAAAAPERAAGADPAPSAPGPRGIAVVRCPPGTQPAELVGVAESRGEGAASPPTVVCVPVRSGAEQAAQPPAREPAAPSGGSASGSAGAAAPAEGAPAPARVAVAPSAGAIPGPAAPPSSPAEPPAGRTARDEQERAAAERALERALVQKGALVVRPGGVEIVPEISYAYGDSSPPRGAPLDAPAGARSEILTGTMTLRLGLPLRLQAEARAPYVFARVTPGGDSAEGPAERSGLGDVRLGLTWHLVRNRGSLPDLLAGGFWKSRSGRTAFDDPARRAPLGTGIEQFGGTLAIVKAVDPVVLLATGTYAVSAARWIPQGWLEAGDQFGASAGAVLAVSPETSLSFSLDAQHARPYRLDHVTVYRSDQTSAVFRVGVATAASRRSFLQVNLGIGLTADVPRFEVSLATPVQF